jgi:CHAT domain-containing protein
MITRLNHSGSIGKTASNYLNRIICLLSLLVFLFYGCGAGLMKDMKTNIEDIKISSLMQKKQHHELIRNLQPMLDRQEALSSFRLFLLAAAYYEIRDYEKMFKTADLLEKQIGQGDIGGYGGNLTVYPQILRGYAYLDQGLFGKALKEARESLVVLNRDANRDNSFYRSQLIDISCIAGVASALEGRMRDADAHLKTIEDVTTIGGILGPEKFIALARIHMAKKDYRSALAAIQDPRANVLGLYTVFYDETFQEIPKYFILVKCLYETGKEEEAKKGYDQLLTHPQIRQIGGLLWPTLLDRARIARRAGDAKLAEDLLKKAVDVIEKQRASINTETGRIGYVGDKQAVYQELISLLCAGNRAAEAFEYVERAKGRALVDLLASQTKIAARGKDTAQINRTLDQLAHAEKETSTVADPTVQSNVAGTRGVVLKLKKELLAQDPEFASLVTVTDTDLKTIQARLGTDEAILEYYATEQDWYAFVLKHNGIWVTKLDGTGLEKDVLDFREKLTRVGSDDYVPHAKALYRRVFAPVAGRLTSPRLIIVPHGVLHYLPFGALSSGKDFLIDRYQIRILPSASILGILKDRARNDKQPSLILGNPDLKDSAYDLKYAEEEARSLGKIIPHATILLRNNARASVIREKGNQYRILHFAAHGVFDPENPLNSALLLAGNGINQGLLRAGDLYQLRLNNDLITLSACETALSTISKGDDVIGFTRGFLYAGARSIVSSLWKVDDKATRDLMVGFYERIPRMKKDKALREAQLNVKQRYPHPFYWAAFQLTGLPE